MHGSEPLADSLDHQRGPTTVASRQIKRAANNGGYEEGVRLKPCVHVTIQPGSQSGCPERLHKVGKARRPLAAQLANHPLRTTQFSVRRTLCNPQFGNSTS